MIKLNSYTVHVKLDERDKVNIQFSAKDTSDKYERTNLELIGFVLDRFPIMGELVTGEYNLKVLLSKLKERIIKIINEASLIEYELSDYQYEKYILINSYFTYIEHWGVCTRITTKTLLTLFDDMEDFLFRWSEKEELLTEIKIAFTNYKKSRSETDYVYNHLSKKGDLFTLVFFEDQFELSSHNYIHKLKLPIHMLKK